MTFSLKVSDQKAAAFADDVDVTIVKARFVDDFDYDGEYDPCLALKVDFQVDGADETFDQNYTAGDLAKLRPTEEGDSLNEEDEDDEGGCGLKPAPGSAAAGLGSNTNTAKFLASLVSSGFDDDELAKNDIRCIEGLHVHVVAEAQKQNKRDVADKKKVRTLLVVNQIHEDPYVPEKGSKKKAKGGEVAKGKKAPVEDDDEEEAAPVKKGKAAPAKKGKVDPVLEATNKAVLEVMEANGGKIAAGKLSTPLFKAVKGEYEPAMVKKITQLAASDEYLEADDAPFDFDGTTLTTKED